jgi:hypothetical protein
MAHEQDVVPLQAAPDARERTDERWPVPVAIAFIAGISAALWATILAAAAWLTG